MSTDADDTRDLDAADPEHTHTYQQSIVEEGALRSQTCPTRVTWRLTAGCRVLTAWMIRLCAVFEQSLVGMSRWLEVAVRLAGFLLQESSRCPHAVMLCPVMYGCAGEDDDDRSAGQWGPIPCRDALGALLKSLEHPCAQTLGCERPRRTSIRGTRPRRRRGSA